MNEGFLPELVPPCRDSVCGCDIVDLMELIQNVLTWSVYLATLLLVLLLVYVGFLYVTNPTNPSNRTKAKGVAMSAVIGFVLVLGAFLIVNTIMNTFGDRNEVGEWTSFFGAERSACEENLIFNTGDPDGEGDIRLSDVGSLADIKEYIAAFISAASSNGLRAVYEVRTQSQRQYLIDNGVPSGNVAAVPQITAPHFSVYSEFGCSGTGSSECHECRDLDFYGIGVKPTANGQAYSFIGEALSRVAQAQEIPGFVVTEGYPKTRNHSCGCHNDGTCVDVNFRF